MPLAPAALITGAPRVSLPFGLFSVVTLRGSGSDRWGVGVQWETGTCDKADGLGAWDCAAQRLTVGGAGLTTFTLTFGAQTTTAIAAAATAATVKAALVALSNVGPNDVNVYGAAGGPWTVTFVGALQNTANLVTATPTGGTGTVTVSQLAGGAGTLGFPKNLDKGRGSVGVAGPFTVYGHFTCSPVGYPLADAQDLATTHLLSREEQRVEQALWSGDLGNTPALAIAGATTVTVAATDDMAVSIGQLEKFIANTYGSVGVIHMTRDAAITAASVDLLTSTGGRLFTALGTPVVAGGGYPGTGPAGQAPAAGTTWLYASPAVFGYRSDVFTSSARPGDLFDHTQNDLYAIAERTYLLGFDPCGVGASLAYLTTAAQP